MLFKKEFDIDKEFFTQNPAFVSKRKIALRVFIVVSVLTFIVLCVSAFSFGFNSKFGKTAVQDVNMPGLKEAQDFFFNALKNYENGNYDKAIDDLNKQLEILDDPDAYNYLAKIYLEKEDIPFAIENFKKALEFKPDFYEANLELGKIYYFLNDYKNASKYLTNALNVQNDNVELLNMTAQTYKMTGRADDAVKIFEHILELEPENNFANSKIGEIYFQRLQYLDAIKYFKKALLISFDENTALQLAKSYLEMDNLDAAFEITDEILEQNPENNQAKSLKISLQYKKGKSKKEKETFISSETVEKKEAELDMNIVNDYIKQIELPIKTNWTPPIGSNLKKASVKFTINKQGELVFKNILLSSGMADFDKSAIDAIELSAPFLPLPDELNRQNLDIIFTFDFNIKE